MEDRDHAPIPRRSGTTAWRHLRGDAALARLSQRIHHHHPWHLRQTELPMPSAQPARTWPQRSLDPQGGRKDHHRDLCHACRTAQGATRGGGLSPLSGVGGAIVGSQRADLQRSPLKTGTHTTENKTADAIRQEVAREIDQLLYVVFSGRRKTGHLDLEAVETAVRAAMHRADSAALTELLQFAAPGTEEERAIGCACG